MSPEDEWRAASLDLPLAQPFPLKGRIQDVDTEIKYNRCVCCFHNAEGDMQPSWPMHLPMCSRKNDTIQHWEGKKKMEKMGNRGNNENLPLGEMRFFVLHCIIFSHRYRWTHYKQYHNKNEIFSSRYYTMSLLIYQGSGVIFRILNKI